MTGGTQHDKTYLQEQMLRELGEKHRGKLPVLLVSSKSFGTIYPGAPQGEIIRPVEIAPVPAIGDTRACPDCGRPQHYTGTEHGWAHDAAFATLACGASPALLAELEK